MDESNTMRSNKTITVEMVCLQTRKYFIVSGRAIAYSVILLIFAACGRPQTEPATDYFWPLDEERVFIYQSPYSGKRIVKIAKIQEEPGRGLIVETRETFEGIDFPVPNPVIRQVFRIAPKKDVIYRLNLSDPESPAEEIYLKTPTRKGAHWRFSWVSHDLRKGKSVRGIGTCRIEGIDTQSVLGKKDVPCAEVRCSFSRKEVQQVRRLFHCKGLGYIGTESAETIEGQKFEPSWVEKLVEIR